MLIGCLVSSAFAQLPEGVKFVEKYLDCNTSLVSWIDLSKIKLEDLERLSVELGDPARMDTFKSLLMSFQEAGGRYIYCLSESPYLVQGQIAVVLPSKNPEKLIDFVKSQNELSSGPGGAPLPPAVRVGEDVVILASSDAILSAIEEKKGELSKNLKAGLIASSGTAGVVVGIPDGNSTMNLSTLVPENSISDPNGKAFLGAVKSLQFFSVHGELPFPVQAKVKLGSNADAQQFVASANQLVTTYGPQGFHLPSLKVDGETVQLAVKSAADVKQSFGTLIERARAEARSSIVMSNLRQLMVAMHVFHDVHGTFPPQSLASKDGKKLLSWRVLILPYIEQQALYDKFHLDEPWDSEHNKALISEMPALLAPSPDEAKKGLTRFVAPLTPTSLFGRKGKAMKVSDITDGTSDTIALIEASPEKSVIWTKPEDVIVDEKNVIASIIDTQQPQFTTAFADGSVRRFPVSVGPAELLEKINIQTPK